jgi:hypothetical protein
MTHNLRPDSLCIAVAVVVVNAFKTFAPDAEGREDPFLQLNTITAFSHSLSISLSTVVHGVGDRAATVRERKGGLPHQRLAFPRSLLFLSSRKSERARRDPGCNDQDERRDFCLKEPWFVSCVAF